MSSIFHADFVDRLRGWREDGMPDECTIERTDTSQDPTFDDDGNPTYPTEQVYSGKCLIQPHSTGERTDVVAGDPQTVSTYSAVIEWDADPVEINDVLTVTSSDDPDFVGMELEVIDVLEGSVEQSRRLTLEARSG